jgi:hypothetical protein
MDLLQGALGVFVVVGFAALVLLIGREVVCWYWKVNATLEQLARLESVLRNIDKNLLVLAEQQVPDDV